MAERALNDYLHRRLINWSRWCRQHQRPGHCASIEHQYRSPQCWNEQEPRPEPIDIFDGQAMEWTVRKLQPLYRDILRLRYVKRYNWQALQRKYRSANVQELVTFAEIALKSALEAQAQANNVHADNSPTLPRRVLSAA